jgi:phosphomannomutase/dTDP-glucose pyrophosphorylase
MTQDRPLKAIILAAGRGKSAGETQSGSGDSARPILMRPLGDGWVIDAVARHALGVVAPSDLCLVIGQHGAELQQHLGDRYAFVRQDQQLGTGHAVLQARGFLAGYEGDVLVLYGDTPLFRVDSLRGLLNRHRLKAADLTLLTAITDAPLPYGRIVRDAAGGILDIVEAGDAADATATTGPLELNAGAYVARAAALLAVLEDLTRDSPEGAARLTDCARLLIRAGKRVEGYRLYDRDEVLGINNDEDLAAAALTLEKRIFAPRRWPDGQDDSRIAFGIGGWRAVIGEGFTVHNVRRLAQALANELVRSGREDKGIVIGFDRRFLADRAAMAAAEVFAGNNTSVVLLAEAAPTPLVTYATVAEGAALGLAFTASHNPPEYNGLKIFNADGSLLGADASERIQQEANLLGRQDLARTDLDIALAAGVVRRSDLLNVYLDAVEAQVDMTAIRGAGLRVVIDPMYGVGKATLEILFTEARCRVTTIHGRHDALFGGRSPAPDLEALGQLMATVREGDFDLGVATDGDADRIAIIDDGGEYIPVNDLLLLLYYHLHANRGLRGGVVRNLATTHALDRLAAHFHESCFETPVGFRHIVAAMQEHDALLGGESSGGLTVRGHILGKDGILAAALVAEVVAATGRPLHEMLDRVFAITGRLFTAEESVPATPEMRVMVPTALRATKLDRIGEVAVARISDLDGTQIVLVDGSWLLLRFSGTEPVLRLMAEAESRAQAAELVAFGRRLVGLDR